MDMVVLIGDGGRRMVKRYFFTYVKRNSDSFLMFRNYIL